MSNSLAQRAHVIRCALTCSASCATSSPSMYSSNRFKQVSHFMTNSHIRPDATSHFRSRSVQIRFQFRNRETGDFRNLFVTALLKNLQCKDQPLVFVERGERALNQLIQFFAKQLVDRHEPPVAQIQDRLVFEIEMMISVRPGPQRFAGDILRDAKEPG